MMSPRIAPAGANRINTQMFSACVFPAYNAAATSAHPGSGRPYSPAQSRAPPQSSHNSEEQSRVRIVTAYGSSKAGGAFMSKEQRSWLGLVYGAVFVFGAAYGIFEHQKKAIDWLTNSLPLIKEILPFFL